MKTKITFHNLQHSDLIEKHVLEGLLKVEEFLPEAELPQNVEVWLKANPPHHEAEIRLKTRNFNLVSQDRNVDIYVACDNAIDKMVSQIKKSKSRMIDQRKDNNKRRIE